MKDIPELGDICHDCALDLNGKWPDGHEATMCMSECNTCKKEKVVCSTGDWNWPDNIKRGMRD